MYKSFLLSILFLAIFSCENQKADTGNVNEKITYDEQGVPTYMDVDLKGYKVADFNLKNDFGKVVFVNFWGSWCPPCRMEMPSIQELYNNYGDKVEFVTVAFEKDRGKHIDFVNENNYNFPVYEAVSPMESVLKPQGFPTTMIIDKKGNVFLKEIGARDWNDDEVHKMLDDLLSK